jgi:hypothetical protein
VVVNVFQGISFGVASTGTVRTYVDDPCPGASYVGHYGGVIRNNFIVVESPDLWATPTDFDAGILLWSACGAQVLHNSVVSTEAPYSSIEWRFDSTDAAIRNNLVSHNLRERGGVALCEGNVESARLDMFASVTEANLHLTPDATEALDMGVTLPAGDCDDDIDGHFRGDPPDVGADEWTAWD